MTFIRSKMLNGAGPYFYEVRSIRDGERVYQEIIKYWGLTDPRPHWKIRRDYGYRRMTCSKLNW